MLKQALVRTLGQVSDDGVVKPLKQHQAAPQSPTLGTRRIWHFTNCDQGGIARYVEHLVSAQARLRDSSHLAIGVFGPPRLSFPTDTERSTYNPTGVTPWGSNAWKFAAEAIFESRRRRRAGSILHSHVFTFGTADVHTIHGLYSRDWGSRFDVEAGAQVPLHNHVQFALLSRLERHVMRSAHHVVFACKENQSFAEEVLHVRRPSNFHVISPGIDASRFNPGLRADLLVNRRVIFPELDAGRRWLLFVGNNFRHKGLLRLLEAMVSIPDAAPFELLVFGNDMAARSQAEAVAARLQPGSVWFFRGDDRLLPAYALSDLFLMDSRSEAGPLVLLEAMASGCVPAVTKFGIVPETVRSGHNGVVCLDSSQVASTALSLDLQAVKEMSKEAVRTAARRTWDAVATEYGLLYAEVHAEGYGVSGRGK